MHAKPSTLLVINPNSTQVVTDHISLALEPFRRPGSTEGPAIVCETLTSGPPGIESQAHVDGISEKLIAWFEAHPHYRNVDAVVLACFSDPGMEALRETLSCPVFGSAECAYLTAAAMADKFGVISILSRAIGRHKRQVRLLGLEEAWRDSGAKTARFRPPRGRGRSQPVPPLARESRTRSRPPGSSRGR